MYYDIFALLSKADIQKTIQTEYDAYCDENKFNQKAFEERHTLATNVENKEKVRAIQVIVNKIELNKQKQYVEKHELSKIVPIGVSIPSVLKIEGKENAIIVNMEEKTTLTTIYNNQIYNVEELDSGSQEVLEKINRLENSIIKAYEICKGTTIYTSNVIDDTKEQPHLEHIIPTLYKIATRVQEVVLESPQKINNVYLTGTLSVVNNIDLYFQELIPNAECKILRPSVLIDSGSQVNIKEYIEVNSAIALALQGLGLGIKSLNFKKETFGNQIGQMISSNLSFGKKKVKKGPKEKKEKKSISLPKFNLNLRGNLDRTERILIRVIIAILLLNIVFVIFSKNIFKQMQEKQSEVEQVITKEKSEIDKINRNASTLNGMTTNYQKLSEELKSINDKISKIAEVRNSIPNLLNQIMYVIPEEVKLTSIENTSGKKITIEAESDNYDQLGYFIAKIKLEGYLKDVVSSSGQKSGNTVKVTIEGELP